MCGLFPGKREIQRCAVPKPNTRCRIVSDRGIDFGVVEAKADLPIILVKAGEPTFTPSADPFESTARATHFRTVLIILLGRDDAQIASPIIEAIAVDMVRNKSTTRLHQEPSQPLRAPGLHVGRDDIWRGRLGVKMQVMGVDQPNIVEVEQDDMPACESGLCETIGLDDDFASPLSPDDRTKLIGEIIAETIVGLGAHRAMTASAIVEITPAAVGRGGQPGPQRGKGNARGTHDGITPVNSASEWSQIGRPQALHRGIRSK